MLDLNLVIVAKDRALQLDSLLRSIRDHYSAYPTSLTILYTTSSETYEHGYNILINRAILPKITWRKETSFATDLRLVVEELPEKSLVQFMTDDDIVFRPFDCSIIDGFKTSDLFFSLRVDCSYGRFKNPIFKQVKPTLRWNWYPFFKNRSANFWYYPFSVDGNIFHTEDIRKMLSLISFKAPNSFEGAMHGARKKWCFMKKRTAIATTQSVLFNNPMNSVQNEGETWNTAISPEWLNQQYLEGKEIDNSVLYAAEPNEVHFAVELKLV